MLGLGFILDGLKGRATDIIGGIMAVVMIGAVLWGLRADHLRAKHLADLHAEQAAHKKTIANYRAAQQAAHDRAVAEKQAAETRYDRLKEQADEDLADAQADADARLAAYIRAHSLRQQAGTAQGNPGRSNLPEAPEATESGDGPGATTVMVSPADLKICTTNTLRLNAVHGWAASITEGAK